MFDPSKPIPFVSARWYTPTTGRVRRKIVIHTMEAPENVRTAENVAAYFHRTTVKASAHYCLDTDSVVQCVQTKDVAWAAPGANHDGVHLELAGYAAQKLQDWEDEYSQSMLLNAALLCGRILVPKLKIPLRFLSAQEMRADPKATGFTTHAAVSEAFRRSTHTDPGAGFPKQDFLRMVAAVMSGG